MYTTSHLADINDMTAMVQGAHRAMAQAQDVMHSIEAAGRSTEKAERGMAEIRRMVRSIERLKRRSMFCQRFGDVNEVNSGCGAAWELLQRMWEAYAQLQRDTDRHAS